MHTCRLHMTEVGDGALQFAFQAAFVTILLHELAGTQTAVLVHKFITVAVVTCNAGGGNFQTHLADTLCRYQQHTGRGIYTIAGIAGLQHLYQLGNIKTGQTRINRLVFLTLGPQYNTETQCDAGSQSDQKTGLTQQVETVKTGQKTSGITAWSCADWYAGIGHFGSHDLVPSIRLACS